MQKKRKNKIVFVNRSSLPLQVQFKHCENSKIEEFEVRKRKVLNVQYERYQIIIYYLCRSVYLNDEENKFLEVGEVPAPCDNKFMAKMIILNYPEKTTRIVCREQISVASILEGVN